MTMAKKFRRKQLICGCCGAYFHTWKEYVDQDQDKGFGICLECQNLEVERNNKQLDEVGATMREALNEKNRAKWDGYDLETQRLLAMKAVEDGMVKFTYGPVVRGRITDAGVKPL
jgi:hypothetical protein